MAKRTVDFRECQAETIKAFDGKRVLLVGQGLTGKPNVMTIGWGSLGILWKRPVFTIYVRPSRFTCPLIEESGEFTVNILPVGREEVAKYCGTTSGRDVDKFATQGLTAVPGNQVRTPVIKECIIHYECRVIYKNPLVPAELDKAILTETYGKTTDFHRLYFGEIVVCCRD